MKPHAEMTWSHLVGLPYVHGSQDCYGLLRRFYADCLEIDLPDYARPEEWWHARPELDLLVANFADVGFEKVDGDRRNLRIGDVPLMAIGTKVVSHCGVIVAPGRLLHHHFNRPSREDLYAGPWADKTMLVVRHKSVPEIKPTKIMNLLDLIPAHKRARYMPIIEEHLRAADPS